MIHGEFQIWINMPRKKNEDTAIDTINAASDKKQDAMMAQLLKLSGAVANHVNPHLNVIRTPSPSINATFGHGWGLPLGFTWVLFGEPKDGKSLVLNSTIGQLHTDDPEAIVIKFDTEFREKGQMTPEMMKVYRIDPRRYICFQVNTPAEVFDRITKEIKALIQNGLKIKLVAIDSINGVQGRRRMASKSIEDVTIGDLAQTIQDGMKAILPVQRDHAGDGSRAFSVICTCQVRSEMDMVEQKRLGNAPKVKMAASWGFKHYAEYVSYVRRNKTAAGKVDLLGRSYEARAGGTDLAGKTESAMFRIIARMKDSSMGPIGRTGELTFSIDKGVVNVSHEVFLMGTGRGVIERSGPNYSYGGNRWNGKEAIVVAMEENPEIMRAIVTDLHKRDLAGEWREIDATNAQAPETDSDVDEDVEAEVGDED